MTGVEPGLLIVVGMGIFLMVLTSYMVFSLYQRCGPNQAMIVSGMWTGEGGRAYKIVIGGGAVVIPMIQQRSMLSLEVMKVDFPDGGNFKNADGALFDARCTAQIKVQADEQAVALAAEQFLGKSDKEVQSLIKDRLKGCLIRTIEEKKSSELEDGTSVLRPALEKEMAQELGKSGLKLVSLSVEHLQKL